MKEKCVIYLSFVSDTGEVIRFSIPHADRDITDVEAQDYADEIIKTQSVLTKQGYPALLKSITRVTSEVEQLF